MKVFNDGETSGTKHSPETISLRKVMRSYQINGEYVLMPENYLNSSQIKGLIQRFITENKPAKRRRITTNDSLNTLMIYQKLLIIF